MMLRPTIYAIYFICIGLVLAESLPSPTGIRVIERTKNSFTIQWKQPPSQEYERFVVKASPDAAMSDVSMELRRTFTGLTPGQSYTVSIQGFTTDGLPSTTLKYEVWTVPDEPANLQLSAVQEIAISISIMGIKTKFTAFVDGMQLEWKDGSHSMEISGYDLQVDPDEGVAVETEDDEFTGTVKRIVTGLTPGKEYSVSLRTRVGPDYDPVLSPPVSGKIRMPPAVPHTLDLVESEPTSVLLKTHGPIEGIHDDLDFELRPNHGVLGDPEPDPNYPMFDLYAWKGLKPGTSYVLDLYAVSKSVKGYKPKTLTFSTAPGPPLKLRVTDYDHRYVTLQWAHPHKFTEFDEVQYRIEFFEIPNGEVQHATVKNFKKGNQVVVQVQELIPGTPYKFQVYTVLNGVMSAVPSSVIQATIPLKPTVEKLVIGRERGISVIFGKPTEGKCPSVKVFYSPSNPAVEPAYYKLGEEISYEEFIVADGHRVHARCVTLNVEGPELVIPPPGELKEDILAPDARNDEPKVRKRLLPCVSNHTSNHTKPAIGVNSTPRPDSIAPDACCNLRPYNTQQKECCGEALLDIGGDRLCCGNDFYNKRFSVCCDGSDGKFVRARRDGCPT